MSVSNSIQSIKELKECIRTATNETIPNGDIDLPLALDVSDTIRSRRIPPRDCMKSLKKRVIETRSNPNTHLASWRLVEVCIKNGGIPFLKEICSKEFMDCFEYVILEQSFMDDNDLRQLCTKMVFELYTSFKNDSQLNYVIKVYERLVNAGVELNFKLPNYEKNSNAIFNSKTPAEWVDSDSCMICYTQFSILHRKHHCRACGGVFCNEDSSNKIPLPDLGIPESVRVCNTCYGDYEFKRKSSRRQSNKKNLLRNENHNQEEVDLKRAIELSVNESKGPEITAPVIEETSSSPVLKHAQEDEDYDPELLAAINASLEQHEVEEKKRSAAKANSQPSTDLEMKSHSHLSSLEEHDILLFASLVEKVKSEPPTAVLENPQLQQLYQKVLGTKLKLNQTLNDTYSKYNTLVNMNNNIFEITSIYDRMLETQLRNISLSQHYAVPQVPSDPYSYNISSMTRHQKLNDQPSDHSIASFIKPAQTLPYNYQNDIKSGHASDLKNIELTSNKETQDLYYDERQKMSYVGNSDSLANASSTQSILDSSYGELDSPKKITSFNFPTVPQQKVQNNVKTSTATRPQSLEVSEPQSQPEIKKQVEQLLIEL